MEYLIMLLPGVIGAGLACWLNKEKISWVKFLLYTIVLDIISNGISMAGLYMIGMSDFDLGNMSWHFQIKYLLLCVVFTCIIIITIYNIRNYSTGYLRLAMKKMFPPSLFLLFTYVVFNPSSLFLGNTREFKIHYIDIIPIILIVGVGLYLCISIIAILVFNGKTIDYFAIFVFSIALCIYIQSNFMNPQFPKMDGAEVNWSAYRTQNIISSVIWSGCIIGSQIIFARSKAKARTEKIMKYASYFITAIQCVSLLVLILTTKQFHSGEYGYSKDGEFTIGTEENIVLFVVDSLDSMVFEEYVSENNDFAKKWTDFTFFTNAVSGAAPTSVAMPLLLTGVEFDPVYDDVDNYLGNVWTETILYQEMKEKGYNVKVFTDNDSLHLSDTDIIENAVKIDKYHIKDYKEFTKYLYKLTNLYTMPQVIKSNFWFATSEMQENISVPKGVYSLDDVEFYKDLQQSKEVKREYQKTFRVYHLNGAHLPFDMNENVQRVERGSVTEKQQIAGVMKELETYLDMLKESGCYEQSTIIVTGDHGQHEDGNLEANPAIMIKQANASHEFTISDAPIHFRNVVATMASTFMEDYSAYGPSVYDITLESDVERYHTVDTTVRNRAFPDKEAMSEPHVRYRIAEDARDRDGYVLYEPEKINRITYTLGDTIDFSKEEEYAKELNYRLYKENGTAIASNELTMCFELMDYTGGDLQLHFTYADIYNEYQTIKPYAHGVKLEEVLCTKENSGQDNVITIPEECIEDNLLVLRLVFPNAVTPHQLDSTNPDTRVLSVAFEFMHLE